MLAITALCCPLMAIAQNSVGSELSQFQQQHGYRLVSTRPFNDQVYTISFVDRTITPSKPFLNEGSFETGEVSPDGKRIAFSHCLAPGFTHPTPNVQECPGGFVLATVKIDGSDLRDFPGLVNQGAPVCWSHDMTKIVTNLQDRRQGGPMRFDDLLVILDLRTAQTEVIERGLPDSFVTPQCWSRDDKQIAYTVNKPIGIRTTRIYDLVSKISKDLADGGFPTWSPNGQWIAYKFCPPSLRGCAYHLIRTSTGEDKVLFASDSGSALSWSPDSRFVAYVSFDFERGVERLRVRRLDDNAESSFDSFEAGAMTWFEWVN
jgi:WD40 repeat protein